MRQEGLFSASQAKDAGISQQLLAKYLASRRVERVKRALYRIVDFPAGDHEDLIAIWLWTRNEGVFSHETALFLLDLSDALPHLAHVTVPRSWRSRQIRIPPEVAVHHADIPPRERSWVGPIPVTAVRRTLIDCLDAHVSPELIAQASQHAAQRGLIAPQEVLSASSIGLWRRSAP